MIAFLMALLTTATVSLSVTPSTGVAPLPVDLHFTVTGPYEGRVCVFVGDDATEEIVAAFCANEEVSLKEGETKEVTHHVDGAPAGHFSLMAVLPDDGNEDEHITSKVVKIVIGAKEEK